MFDDTPPPGDIPLEHVEQQLCELATHLAAATCRFLVLLAQFDRREGWRSWGCRGTAQWLSWRCGMGRGTAREHVRVARALEQLPVTSTEFAAGRLSFSKVRALSRVAVPETEEELVEMAKEGTASHVERIVRGCRRAESAADPQRQRPRCFARWRREEDGTISITARLDAAEGELVVAAIKAQRDGPPAPVADEGHERTVHRREDPHLSEAQSADSDPGPPDGGDPEPVDEEPADPGFLPRRSNADALVAMAKASLSTQGEAAMEAYRVLVLVDEAVLSAPTGEEGVAGTCRVDGGAALMPEQARRIACDTTAALLLRGSDRRAIDIGRSRRQPPPRMRRLLRLQDGGCRFPGCQQTRRVNAHHVRHWARGGSTSLDNLVLLCTAHHWAVHEGGFSLTGTRAAGFVFRRPDGKAVGAAPDAPPLEGSVEDASRLGLADGSELRAGWHGDRLDLHYAVSALLDRRDYALSRRSPVP